MKQEVKSIVFKNFTDEEFLCSWDGVPYRFAPGKEMYVEDWKADHFAKHLVNRVMHKKGLITTNKVERDIYLAQALPAEKEITVAEAMDINATIEATEAISEKEEKKTKKKVEEEEFIGLKK